MIEYFSRFYVQMDLGISYIFSEVIFCICLVILYNDRDFSRRGPAVRLGDAAATYAACLLLNAVLYAATGTVEYERTILLPLLVAAHAPLMNRQDWTCRAAMGLVFYATYRLIFVIASDGAIWLRLVGVIPETWGRFDMTTVTSIVMPLLTVIYLRLLSVSRFRHRHNACTALVLTAAVLSVFMLDCMGRMGMEDAVLKVRCVACCVMWAILLLSYYMLYAVTKEYNSNLQLQAEKLRENTDRIISDFSGANFEELRQLRHDLRNHFSYVGALLDAGNYDEARRYFSSLSADAATPLGYIDCGNGVVSAIVNFERMRAASGSITLVSHLSVPPALPLQDSELCSLLSNLLDNAIDACREAEAGEPTIELTVLQRQSYLSITVSNPVSEKIPPEERLRLISTKADRHLHGYGTRIIRRIVRDHNGVCRNEIRGGRFIASVMLELREEAS